MRPRLLDLFCGAGGAAKGYQLAGFHVTGIDISPQPNYCGDAFIQADAMEVMRDGGLWHDGNGCSAVDSDEDLDLGMFDAIHASPVCYGWSKMRDCRPGTKDDQPDYITPLRPLLKRSGLPWVMENVPGSPLLNHVQICGSGLGLPLQRHRWFESNVPLWGVQCAHAQNPWNPAYGHSTGRKRRRVPVIGEWRIKKHLQDEAMGIDWMTLEELTEAIPPAYTEHVGSQLIERLTSLALAGEGEG